MPAALLAPSVHSVWFEWHHDPFGESDYLERSAADHFGVDGSNWSHVSDEDKAKVIIEHGSIWKACEHYASEDADRLREFRDGDWCFESCRAVAEIRYELTQGTFRIEHLSSGSLCGIESDSGDPYRREVEREQLSELSQHLERFGVIGSSVDHLHKLIRTDFPQTRWGDFVDAT